MLPGGKRTEDIFYEFLRDLPANDPFWGGTGQYTQQVCFRNLANISDNREIMKKWFMFQAQYWGSGCSKLFNRWKKENEDIVERFRDEFEKTLDKTAYF